MNTHQAVHMRSVGHVFETPVRGHDYIDSRPALAIRGYSICGFGIRGSRFLRNNTPANGEGNLYSEIVLIPVRSFKAGYCDCRKYDCCPVNVSSKTDGHHRQNLSDFSSAFWRAGKLRI